MKSMVTKWLGIVLVLEIGLLNLLQAQSAYDKAAYLGYLLVIVFSITLIAAYGIYRETRWGWLLATLDAFGLLGFALWNQLITYQGLRLDEWFDPYALTATIMTAAFILLVALRRPWKMLAASEDVLSINPRVGYVFSFLGLLFMLFTTLSSYQMGTVIKTLASQSDHRHVGSLKAVCSTPLTSLAALEENYGIQVSLVAVTAMHSIVDVRLKIIDPDKAHALLANQAAVLINQQALILSPHLHTHYKLKPGKMFFMFFPTQKTIIPGSQLSLVFGSVRVEPITVK
jgi:hypothetical protein